MSGTRYNVPYLKDEYGREYPCTSVLKDIEFQPKTGDIFYTIKIIGLDRCSIRYRFLFMNEADMDKKYEELWNDFRNQMVSILEEKRKWI